MLHLRRLLLLLPLVFMGSVVQAAMVAVPLQVTTNRATAIVQGEVVAQSSAWDRDHRTILTDVLVRVDESFKGSLEKGQFVTIRVEGGEVGETGIWVEHQPRFNDHEQVLLFLTPEETGVRAVQSLEQGKYTVFDEVVYDYRGRRESLPALKSTIRSMTAEAGEPDER